MSWTKSAMKKNKEDNWIENIALKEAFKKIR